MPDKQRFMEMVNRTQLPQEQIKWKMNESTAQAVKSKE